MLNLHFSPFPILHTSRLTLRAMHEKDVNEIFALRSSDTVNQYLDRPKAESLDDAAAFIQKINMAIQRNESIAWAIVFKNQPNLMGTICIWNIDVDAHSAEIGYELIPDFQGNGIMQEVFPIIISFGFEIMQLRTIEAHTVFNNKRSIRVLEKNNFKLKENQSNEIETADELVYFLDNKTTE